MPFDAPSHRSISGVEITDTADARTYAHAGTSLVLRQPSERRIEVSRVDFTEEGFWLPPKRTYELADDLLDLAKADQTDYETQYWLDKRPGTKRASKPSVDSIEMHCEKGAPIATLYGNQALSLDPDGCRCSIPASLRLLRALGLDLALIQPEEDGPAIGSLASIQRATLAREAITMPAIARASLGAQVLGTRA